MEQRAVAPAQPDHGVVNGCVAVGVQLHGSTHHVGGFGAVPVEQLHLVHGVQQLPMAGLETVDLRDSTADDYAHGVGHIVNLQCLGDGLFQHLCPESFDVAVDNRSFYRFFFASSCHFLPHIADCHSSFCIVSQYNMIIVRLQGREKTEKCRFRIIQFSKKSCKTNAILQINLTKML